MHILSLIWNFFTVMVSGVKGSFGYIIGLFFTVVGLALISGFATNPLSTTVVGTISFAIGSIVLFQKIQKDFKEIKTKVHRNSNSHEE